MHFSLWVVHLVESSDRDWRSFFLFSCCLHRGSAIRWEEASSEPEPHQRFSCFSSELSKVEPLSSSALKERRESLRLLLLSIGFSRLKSPSTRPFVYDITLHTYILHYALAIINHLILLQRPQCWKTYSKCLILQIWTEIENERLTKNTGKINTHPTEYMLILA